MKQQTLEQQLAVFDKMLDSLSQLAADEQTEQPVFFAKTIQVLEAILEPKWSSILVRSRGEMIRVEGSRSAPRNLAPFIQADDRQAENPFHAAPSNWCVAEIKRNTQTWGWLVTSFGNPVESLQSELHAGISEIIGDFVARNESQQDSNKDTARVQQFSINVHRSLDSQEVAHHLANDARLILNVERVSIFSAMDARAQLLAVSSVGQAEVRSRWGQSLTKLARYGAKQRQPFFSDNYVDDTSGQGVGKMLVEHIAETRLPFVAGIPIFQLSNVQIQSSNARLVGYLVAESTVDVNRLRFAQGLDQIVPHAATALANALSFEGIPLRGLGAWFRRPAWLKTPLILLALLVMAWLATQFWQTDFKVRIHGELQPLVERDVYSPMDGVIEEVLVEQGDFVEFGEAVLKLSSSELDLEWEQNAKQQQQLLQLKDLKSITLNQVSQVNDPAETAKLASELADLDHQLLAIQAKSEYLNQQRARLVITSPIKGKVTTWQTQTELKNRPVRWGESVLNIAHLDGEWDMVFYVPERQVGFILAHANSSTKGVELEVFLDSDPQARHRVSVSKIDTVAFDIPELGRVTKVHCRVPASIQNRRKLASVTADAFCGQKSLWYCWTREMIDTWRRKFVW